MSALSTSYLVLFLTFSVVPPSLQEAPKQKDIQCKVSDVASIFRSLTIDGPGNPWEYSALNQITPNAKNTKAAGTYLLVDDLVVFTGKMQTEQTSKEVRFAFNYGLNGKDVHFDNFFPAGDTLRYHRRWYWKIGAEWKTREELVLSIPRVALTWISLASFLPRFHIGMTE
jgi:hypothetical protein